MGWSVFESVLKRDVIMSKKQPAILIIDRPISPFSSRKEIAAWIERLKKMPQLPEVLSEIAIAKKFLKSALD